MKGVYVHVYVSCGHENPVLQPQTEAKILGEFLTQPVFFFIILI